MGLVNVSPGSRCPALTSSICRIWCRDLRRVSLEVTIALPISITSAEAIKYSFERLPKWPWGYIDRLGVSHTASASVEPPYAPRKRFIPCACSCYSSAAIALAVSDHTGIVGSAFVTFLYLDFCSHLPLSHDRKSAVPPGRFCFQRLPWPLINKIGFDPLNLRILDNQLRSCQCIDVSSRQRVERAKTS